MTAEWAPVDRVGVALRQLPMFRGKVRATRTAARLLPAAACVRDVRVDGVVYRVDVRSRTEAGVFVDGPHDYVTQVLTRLLTPDSVVLDVGANVGLVTLPLAVRLRAARGKGRVLAVEPVPANVARLRDAVALNDVGDRVEVLPVALTDSPGTVTVHVDPEAATGNAVVHGARAGARPVSVPAVRLDDLRERGRLPRLDVVKLDVEGAEVLVLRGAREVLAADRPVLLGEFHRGLMPLFGHTMADAGALLAPLGYQFFAFRAGLELDRVEPTPGIGDLLCVPEERVAHVRASLAGHR